MDKTTHVIKRSELPQGVTLEQATADFINSIPRDLFSFDKIEITEDEAIIEYHAILVKLMGEPFTSFNQAVMECLKDPSVEGLMAYHGLVAGPSDILDHHDRLFDTQSKEVKIRLELRDSAWRHGVKKWFADHPNVFTERDGFPVIIPNGDIHLEDFKSSGCCVAKVVSIEFDDIRNVKDHHTMDDYAIVRIDPAIDLEGAWLSLVGDGRVKSDFNLNAHVFFEDVFGFVMYFDKKGENHGNSDSEE